MISFSQTHLSSPGLVFLRVKLYKPMMASVIASVVFMLDNLVKLEEIIGSEKHF